MEDKTPEDVAFEKMLKRSGKAYDKAMPEADTTYGDMEVKPLGRSKPDSGGDIKPLGRSRTDSGGDIKPIGRARGSMKDFAKGGSISSSMKRHDDFISQHEANGFKHHKHEFKKHAAGHEHHMDAAAKMCGGGMAKGK